MCGIAGILGTSDGFAVDEELVTTMREVIHHRGPDDGGSWHSPEDRVAFAHRRLSIIDLRPTGHQPMSNEDGTVWITFGGEIYNHMDIRPELEAKGHRYHSNTDTETIVHLYEEEGIRCLERLHGMFHLAIWDSRTKELHLARDRLGKKPLYYAQPPGGLVFGSEIKALLAHPALTAELDEEAFFDYLTFVCTPAPMTMFKGVRKLGPAERMTVRADGSTEVETFWSPFSHEVAAEVSGMEEPELEERLLALLRESIRRRMMSDVPFGVFLSGGVDSSTIPVTYVPARNTIFLSFALAWAEVLGAADIFIGVNALDYSGYPDCRPEFIAAFEQLARVATKAGVEGARFTIHTPLIAMTKADIIRRGLALGLDYQLTHSCYDPSADGSPCGTCDSCVLRARGFAEAGVGDPLRLR